MPRRIAIEMKCDRCPAVWFDDYEPGQEDAPVSSFEMSLNIVVDGQVVPREVAFNVLCTKCEDTVKNYVDSIDRDPAARRKPRAKKPGANVVAEAPRESGKGRPPEGSVKRPVGADPGIAPSLSSGGGSSAASRPK